MTPGLQKAKRSIGRLAVGLALLALPGCGGVDGVEFNGKIFDAVGLTGALGKKEEPKVAQRAPLVLPPTTERLPEPGENPGAAPVQTAQAWPNDPDKQRASDADAKKKAQTAYCKDGNWKEKAMGDEEAAAMGPNGSCGNFFTALNKSLFGE